MTDDTDLLNLMEAIKSNSPDLVHDVCNAYDAGLMLNREVWDMYMHVMLVVSVRRLQDNYGPKYVAEHLQALVNEMRKECN